MPHVGDPRHVIRETLLPLASARYAAADVLGRQMTYETASGVKLQGVKHALESRHFRLDEDEAEFLAMILRIAPSEIETLYRVKERLCDLLQLSDRNKLDAGLTELSLSVDSLDSAADRLRGFFQTVMVDYRESVLNGADHHISTAYVENAIKRFKYRYRLWTVSRDFRFHYIRTLVLDGPMTGQELHEMAVTVSRQYSKNKPYMEGGEDE